MFWQTKHREASEQAFFLFIIWRCLAEALGTYGLDMIPGTRFPGGTEATGAWRRFLVSFSSQPGLGQAPVQHISFSWSRQHGINRRWRMDLAFWGEGCKQKGRRGDLDMEATAADDDTACTQPTHTHTHKIDWRVRRHRGGATKYDTTAMLL